MPSHRTRWRPNRASVGVAVGTEPLAGRPQLVTGTTQQEFVTEAKEDIPHIGDDYGMPASADYADASRFHGHIDVVQIDVGEDDHSLTLIDPAAVARVATSRQ